MSEKRFKGYAEKTGRHHELIIIDSLGEEYSITDDFFKSKDVIFDIVDLLNVMNDTLLEQAKENHKLNEQQATISQLQDLCGKSDYENAKLRLKNKELQEELKLLKPVNIEQYEQIVQLQEENEQLRQQLKEKEEDEQLYANEIVKLNKEAKEVLDFKSLGDNY